MENVLSKDVLFTSRYYDVAVGYWFLNEAFHWELDTDNPSWAHEYRGTDAASLGVKVTQL